MQIYQYRTAHDVVETVEQLFILSLLPPPPSFTFDQSAKSIFIPTQNVSRFCVNCQTCRKRQISNDSTFFEPRRIEFGNVWDSSRRKPVKSHSPSISIFSAGREHASCSYVFGTRQFASKNKNRLSGRRHWWRSCWPHTQTHAHPSKSKIKSTKKKQRIPFFYWLLFTCGLPFRFGSFCLLRKTFCR